MNRHKHIFNQQKCALLVIVIMLGAIIAGCSQQEENPDIKVQNNTQAVDENQGKTLENRFPRSVDIHGEVVTVNEKPKKIAALSLNVAEVAMDLVEAENIVAVTTSMGNESLSHYSNEYEEITNKVAGATSLDPEAVLAYDPDLVLLTLTHGAEQDARTMLESAGVPLASFDQWSTVQVLLENYKLIGQLVGEEERAEQIVKEMEEKVSQAQAAVKDIKEKPSVLLLSQVGPNTGPYILGPTSIAYDIVNLAGGTPASDILGIDKTTPASIEHVINLNPDYIILVEWGSTSGEFNELIQSPGFQMLSAVQAGNVKQIEAKYISQASRHVVDVLDDLVDWIHAK